MTDVSFVDVCTDSDLERYLSVEAESFGEPEAEIDAEGRAAREHALMRMLLAGDEVVAGYSLMGVGQFFGGRSVPAQAVASVFVHPAWRRQGIAGSLLADLVDAARGLGTGLAPLYASTTRLYRRYGWEVGDRTLWCRVRTDALSHLRGSGRARSRPGRSELESFRRRFLPEYDGPFDRPEWWLDVHWDTEGKRDGRREYGWYEDGRLTGYVMLRESFEHREVFIAVQDLVAETPDALRGLLGFLGGHEAQVAEITIKRAGIHINELMYLLPDADKAVAVDGSISWMQRIIDVDCAVQRRGWPGAPDSRLELEISDPCAEQPSRAVLEIAGGEGAVSTGGSGRIRCGLGALSAWYSSRLTAREARRLSMLEATDADVAVMDAVIARRPWWEPDYF